MAGHVKEFAESSFQGDVLSSASPVLVDFWAPWCGPCRMIAPMIEELAAENQGSVTVGKINIDENQNLAMEYGIHSIPTLLVFKGGQVVRKFQGVQPKSRLQQALDEVKGAVSA
jgi:thioredoxin 1